MAPISPRGQGGEFSGHRFPDGAPFERRESVLEVDIDNSHRCIPSREVPGMLVWRERLFAFMALNATRATSYYHVPPDRVVELGIQIEI